MNPLKRKLLSKEPAYGHLVMEFYTAGTAQILASAGLDFVIYDMEHGRCDINRLSELAVAGRGAGLTVIARPPDLTAAPLGRLLDVGVHGIMVPRVENAEQAHEIVAAVKYAPDGRRGVAVGIAHDDYRAKGPGYFAQANKETVVIAILETVAAFLRWRRITIFGLSASIRTSASSKSSISNHSKTPLPCALAGYPIGP